MEKVILPLLAIAFLLAGTAAGQDNSGAKSKPTKPFSISAKVSEDGKSLIGYKGESWLVTNPGSLVGHVGQLVKLKVQLVSSGQDVRVLSVKSLVVRTQYTANPGDSAFRR